MEKLIKTTLGQWSILAKSELEKNQRNDALGINPNSRMKFKPDFDQKQFIKYVQEKADHMCSTGYVRGKPEDWVWHYEPNYELAKLTHIKKDKQGWVSWYDGELTEWAYDHGPLERANHFPKWSKEPEKKPIIIIEGTDGRNHIIDGHHRVGYAHKIDMKSVPIIYGRRKDNK